MEVSVVRLQNARDVMVRMIKERPDGKRYVPIVLKLEKEIKSLRGLDDDYERILADAA